MSSVSSFKLTFAVGNDEDRTHYGKDKGSNRETECYENITSDAAPWVWGREEQ